jgi:hypothetical protein
VAVKWAGEEGESGFRRANDEMEILMTLTENVKMNTLRPLPFFSAFLLELLHTVLCRVQSFL